MGEGIGAIVAEIDALPAADSAEHLSRLEYLMDRYFSAAEAADHLGVWFRLYERFPEDDGYELFWSILHRIEAHPGCERLVVESVRRRPSRFPVMMVNGLLNAGIRRVDGVELLELLRQVADDERCLPSIRKGAQSFLADQRSWAEADTEPDRDRGQASPDS